MTQAPVAPMALPEGYYQSFTHTVDGKTLRIWAIKENLQYFATETPDSEAPVLPVNWTVGATKVRRYPGDPEPYNRAGYTATKALPITRGKAIPGKPFALDDGTEFRVFSYVGSLTALYSILKTKIKIDCVLHTPSGRSFPIVKAAP